MSESCDVVIIGAGHNGLTCAGYLARAGYSVEVVERRHVVGGAAVTEEFHPGFRNSTCSYVVSLLNSKIIDELELYKYGLEILDTSGGSIIPLTTSNALILSPDENEFLAAMKAFSPNDIKNLEVLESVIEKAADVLRDIVLETPPNIGGGLVELLKVGKVANRLRKLPPDMRHAVIKLFTMSVADFLSEYIEHTTIKAMLALQSFIGTMTSPYAPGSAYVLLHHFFGVVNGRKGAWCHARGGMGSITQAMARSAEAFGAKIHVNAAVKEVIVENGVARGVLLEDGRKKMARVVSANTNPKLLFQQLIAPQHVDPVFMKRINNYRCHSATFRMNVALNELPKFTALQNYSEDEQRELLGGIVQYTPSIEYIEQAYIDARLLGYSKEPIMEIYIPSTLDDSLAPPGKHVMSLFCQHFMYDQPDGRKWDDIREEVADHIIDFVTQYAPNFRRSILGRKILSPVDLEREFGLIGGDIFHGVLAQDQIYSLRPTDGYANYRMPIGNLYLCGSGAHPGGGVSGCPGHNAAREIISDIRKHKLKK